MSNASTSCRPDPGGRAAPASRARATPRARWRRFAPAALLALLATAACAQPVEESWAERDRRLVDAALAAMPAQRPGVPDLYVLGVAGDGLEDVFRNEIAHLERVAARRLDNGGRTLTLVNHPDSLDHLPRPLATLDSLRHALRGIARAMDPGEDLLLLFLTTHGSEDHLLVAQLPPIVDEAIPPADLRAALDDAGIRHRVLVISACYSGGFVRELQGPDTLLITAASADRPSFGCGAESDLTYFGRAWLVDGLNRTVSFVGAYDEATRAIAARERAEGFEPSLPQLSTGTRIGQRLQAWLDRIEPGPPVPFEVPEAGPDAP